MLLSGYTLTIIVKGTRGEYELVILRPSHFLIGNFPVVIKHPVTQNFTTFYASENRDGSLREGSPTGPPLPPFQSRGEINREIPLNPILVNWAATIRLRRFIRQKCMQESTFAHHVIDVLRNVMRLHAAVIWNPQQSHKMQFTVDVPGLGSRSMQDWPYFPTRDQAMQPGSSSLGPDPGIETRRNTELEDALELFEEGGVLLCLSSYTTS